MKIITEVKVIPEKVVPAKTIDVAVYECETCGKQFDHAHKYYCEMHERDHLVIKTVEVGDYHLSWFADKESFDKYCAAYSFAHFSWLKPGYYLLSDDGLYDVYMHLEQYCNKKKDYITELSDALKPFLKLAKDV